MTVARHILSHWRLKAGLGVALTVLFCAPYFALQRVALVPARTLPLTALDHLIPFRPGWAFGYVSLYLLLPIASWVASTRRQLAAYTRGFLVLSVVAFACFLFFPVEFPRPAGAPASGLYGLVTRFDRPLNAFPSLHIGLAVYSVLFSRRVVTVEDPTPAGRAFVAALWAWVLAIAYATLATKQHYALDLPAGALLAWGADAWAWRRRYARPVRAEPGESLPVSSPSVS